MFRRSRPQTRPLPAILADRSVVCWGDPDSGGDSSAVLAQLRDVQQIQACDRAFAAILGDGSVVTWGHAAPGADSSAVEHQLQDVKQIQATCHAFAALLGNGFCGDLGAMLIAEVTALPCRAC